jgi:hypothetical protein
MLKQDRIDYCNGRDDKCCRNESILTQSSAVLAILINGWKAQKRKPYPMSPEIKKSGLISSSDQLTVMRLKSVWDDSYVYCMLSHSRSRTTQRQTMKINGNDAD